MENFQASDAALQVTFSLGFKLVVALVGVWAGLSCVALLRRLLWHPRGIATVEWWPLQSRAGGLSEVADAPAFAVSEEGCTVSLRDGYWHCTTPAGVRFVVSASSAVVTWAGPPAEKPTEVRRPQPAPQPVGQPAAAPTVFLCPTCHESYGLAVDAAVCERRDSVEPQPSDFDCPACGYPASLHHARTAATDRTCCVGPASEQVAWRSGYGLD